MWLLRFQNCFKPTPDISTMLFDCDIGVSGFGRSRSAEQRGIMKVVRFSYRAKSRNSLAGVVWVPLDLEVEMVVDTADLA